MIKRILVALDPDPDTPVATEYAIRLAKKFDANLTGLALVDIDNINSATGGGGIGTIYFAEMLREHHTKAGREEASRLLKAFEEKVERADVKHAEIMEEGVPYERIVEDMKYHDLLVVGRDSHFFYNKPEQETDTLAEVVKNGVAPVLVVTDVYRDVNKVVAAYDGSDAAARTLQYFVHLAPYGRDVNIELVHVAEGSSREEMDEAELLLELATGYLTAHGFNNLNQTILDAGSPERLLLDHAAKTGGDAILIGAHSVSAIKRMAFGSVTETMITQSQVPLFISH